MENKKLITAYNKLKLELDRERHSETLRKFKILNKAYKLGNKIYGSRSFSIMRLSMDMDFPITTCKRILSLRKANKRTWKLINTNKITSFKVTMVLLKKDTAFQDEMINLVIKDNLSTYQIKSLNIKNLNDIQKERLRIAVENGFSRASTCYYSFHSTLERLEQLLLLKVSELPKSKIPELRKQLIELSPKLKEYAKGLK